MAVPIRSFRFKPASRHFWPSLWLMFWNKLLVMFHRVFGRSKPKVSEEIAPADASVPASEQSREQP